MSQGIERYITEQMGATNIAILELRTEIAASRTQLGQVQTDVDATRRQVADLSSALLGPNGLATRTHAVEKKTETLVEKSQKWGGVAALAIVVFDNLPKIVETVMKWLN